MILFSFAGKCRTTRVLQYKKSSLLFYESDRSQYAGYSCYSAPTWSGKLERNLPRHILDFLKWHSIHIIIFFPHLHPGGERPRLLDLWATRRRMTLAVEPRWRPAHRTTVSFFSTDGYFMIMSDVIGAKPNCTCVIKCNENLNWRELDRLVVSRRNLVLRERNGVTWRKGSWGPGCFPIWSLTGRRRLWCGCHSAAWNMESMKSRYCNPCSPSADGTLFHTK